MKSHTFMCCIWEVYIHGLHTRIQSFHPSCNFLVSEFQDWCCHVYNQWRISLKRLLKKQTNKNSFNFFCAFQIKRNVKWNLPRPSHAKSWEANLQVQPKLENSESSNNELSSSGNIYELKLQDHCDELSSGWILSTSPTSETRSTARRETNQIWNKRKLKDYLTNKQLRNRQQRLQLTRLWHDNNNDMTLTKFWK